MARKIEPTPAMLAALGRASEDVWLEECKRKLVLHAELQQKVNLNEAKLAMIRTTYSHSQRSTSTALATVIELGAKGDGVRDALKHLREQARWKESWSKDITDLEKAIQKSREAMQLLERQLMETPCPGEQALDSHQEAMENDEGNPSSPPDA